MFREAVLAFLGEGEKKESIEDAYCKACRIAKKDDCRSCDKKIEAIDGR